MGPWRRIGAFGALGNIERERIHEAIATGRTDRLRKLKAGLRVTGTDK
jgi:hypothetical protein